MSGKRQNIQLRLSFGEEGRSEAPKAPGEGSETPTAKRMIESPARNYEQLMEEVCERENCLQAFKRVKSNKGSPGIDGMTVEQLPGHLKEHWPAIREQLLSGTYKPQPVKRVEILKPDGGVRQLGIPTADRKFLGFSLTRAHEPKRRIAVKAMVRFKRKVRELTDGNGALASSR
jgi:RNA-directed DNA polymerase